MFKFVYNLRRLPIFHMMQLEIILDLHLSKYKYSSSAQIVFEVMTMSDSIPNWCKL